MRRVLAAGARPHDALALTVDDPEGTKEQSCHQERAPESVAPAPPCEIPCHVQLHFAQCLPWTQSPLLQARGSHTALPHLIICAETNASAAQRRASSPGCHANVLPYRHTED